MLLESLFRALLFKSLKNWQATQKSEKTQCICFLSVLCSLSAEKRARIFRGPLQARVPLSHFNINRYPPVVQPPSQHTYTNWHVCKRKKNNERSWNALGLPWWNHVSDFICYIIYSVLILLICATVTHQSTVVTVILELKHWDEELVNSPSNKYLY